MTYNITPNSKVVSDVAGTYNIEKTDANGTTFIADDTSTVIFNLPAASDILEGTYYTFKKKGGGGNVNIVPDGSDEIDGVNSATVISGIWDTYTIVCDGSGWYLLSFGSS